MISYPIKIDGQTFPGIHVMKIKRSAKVLDTDLTERVQNGDMDRDVVGTFYNYSMEIDSDDATPEVYDAFYELITSPDEFHDVEIPYGQGVLAQKMYVSGAEDELLAMLSHQNRWGNHTVNFIAKSPTRRPT